MKRRVERGYMKKDELVNEYWCNLFVCAGLLLSVLLVLVTCIKNNDYSSLIYGGGVYMIPCTVECIRFNFYDNKRNPFGYNIQKFIQILRRVCFGYMIANLIFILYNPSNEAIVYTFAWITVICMLGYPCKAAMFSMFYSKRISEHGEEEGWK